MDKIRGKEFVRTMYTDPLEVLNDMETTFCVSYIRPIFLVVTGSTHRVYGKVPVEQTHGEMLTDFR